LATAATIPEGSTVSAARAAATMAARSRRRN
jgi:hypothetical protein